MTSKPTPEQIEREVQRVTRYFRQLLSNSFSGKVTVRIDRNVIQPPIKREETDLIEVA